MPHGSDARPGDPAPLGATVMNGGVNFSLFSANATAVDLLLFDRHDQPRPTRVIPLAGADHRTYYYWHAFVPEIGDGQRDLGRVPRVGGQRINLIDSGVER